MLTFIGYDEREHMACEVAKRTLERHSSMRAVPLREAMLRSAGLFWRPVDRRGSSIHDFNSNATWSTEFAVTRFFTPLLAHEGWALFMDCDVVVNENVERMLAECIGPVTGGKAVYVVKHYHKPDEAWKMVNQPQTIYPRKNWSSVMLFDCSHPAHQRLNLHLINTMPGRWLHAFGWLHDSEIGDLHPRWNQLVNEQSAPLEPARGILHFTNGGPWLPGWRGAQHDDLWLQAAESVGVLTRAEP